jgi:hypothetical protein
MPITNTRYDDLWERLLTFGYLVPVVGFIPALGRLYSQNATPKQLSVCRLSVLLTIVWIVTYASLTVGGNLSPEFSMRLLFLNSLCTSGYFLVSLWLMVSFWQGKSLRLPGFSPLADQLLDKN